ncbi:unnamed protein product [Blepharisma stoltei]|uniref:EF-hand domain-containing protein n=1 Tax=Blepharisma stoltei TaxID=1481888 RepID=A0AAU9K797_9CILI|nr:unnamed protein product [Blepharisma stoltei]
MSNLLETLRLTPRNTSRPKEKANSSFSFTSYQPIPHRRSISNSLGLSQIRTNLKKLQDTPKISLLPEISPRHKEAISIAFKKTLKITVDMPKVELQSVVSSNDNNQSTPNKTATSPTDKCVQTRDSPSPRSALKGLEFKLKSPYKLQSNRRPLTPWLARMRTKLLLNRFGPLPISKNWSNNYTVSYQPIMLSKRQVNLVSPNNQHCWVMQLANDLTTFLEFIENAYKPVYDEIDLAQKGFINLDDLVNFVILKTFVNNQNIEDANYENIKDKAKEILGVLGIVTKKTKIFRKDVMALCSVFEYFNENRVELDLFSSSVLRELSDYLEKLKEIFKCYSHNNVITQKDLGQILDIFKKKNEFKILESLIGLEPIDFSKFLRFIPFFNQLHIKTLSQFEN